MLFSNNRDQLRQFYCEVWRKHGTGLTLEPLEIQIRDVILMHPEYHSLLAHPDQALGREYLPEFGETNPFLHMGLHLAIREQVGTRRPAGIEAVHERLARSLGDAHAAEHRMIEVLAEGLWDAQRAGIAPDEQRYLERLRRLS